MLKKFLLLAFIGSIGTGVLLYATLGVGQQRAPASPDAVEEAQSSRPPTSKRVEQEKSPHDQSDVFNGTAAPDSSPALENQPDQGTMLGFDLARDPLNAKRPMQPAEES
jgi:hypothetical protein